MKGERSGPEYKYGSLRVKTVVEAQRGCAPWGGEPRGPSGWAQRRRCSGGRGRGARGPSHPLSSLPEVSVPPSRSPRGLRTSLLTSNLPFHLNVFHRASASCCQRSCGRHGGITPLYRWEPDPGLCRVARLGLAPTPLWLQDVCAGPIVLPAPSWLLCCGWRRRGEAPSLILSLA